MNNVRQTESEIHFFLDLILSNVTDGSARILTDLKQKQ